MRRIEVAEEYLPPFSGKVLNVPIYGQRTMMFLLISADNHDGNRVAEDMATRRAKAGTASTESGARPLDL